MASSRHSRSSSSRRGAAQKPAPPVDEDDLSVDLPEGNATFAEEEAFASDEDAAERSPSSSRRGAQRSSRRMSATSDKKSARRSSRLSPEESAARRRALFSAIKLALGLIILVGGAFAIYWFLIRDDPRASKAKALISDIKTQNIRTIDSSLDNQKPEDAEKAMAEAKKKLEDNPDLGRPDLAPLAEDVKTMLSDRDNRIARVKRDVRASGNYANLQAQFAHVGEPETNLETLEADANAFMDNPVDPKGGHNEDYVKTYSDKVNAIHVQMAQIQTVRSQRKIAETTTPVEQARGQAKVLMQQQKYQDALSAIDEAARKYPNANFTAIREWVDGEAKKMWETEKSVVENLYKDYEAIGSSAATRKEAIDKARARLHAVIDNYGIAAYVDEAKQLLARYPE